MPLLAAVLRERDPALECDRWRVAQNGLSIW
jgi:hypothetical protein